MGTRTVGLKDRKKGSRTARWSEEKTQMGTGRGKSKKKLNRKKDSEI